jgi:molybdenum cofactor cytidylyltransferase
MICAIVLAAGRSQRMGTQKLLLPWRNKSVIAHIVDEVLRSPVDRVLIIVGSDAEKIKEALASREVTFVHNPDEHGDMLSSIRCGLRALPVGCDAVLVVLGDQPAITSELVAQLVDSFQKNPQYIMLPAYHGKRGHPILFPSRFIGEVFNNHDGVGLKGLLSHHPGRIVEVAIPAGEPLQDIDTPEDYAALSHPPVNSKILVALDEVVR